MIHTVAQVDVIHVRFVWNNNAHRSDKDDDGESTERSAAFAELDPVRGSDGAVGFEAGRGPRYAEASPRRRAQGLPPRRTRLALPAAMRVFDVGTQFDCHIRCGVTVDA